MKVQISEEALPRTALLGAGEAGNLAHEVPALSCEGSQHLKGTLSRAPGPTVAPYA